MKDYYLILGVHPDDLTETIRSAYKLMSQKYHPDKNLGDRYFEERFKDINEAYQVLKDPEKRKIYDYERLGINSNQKTDFFNPGASNNREAKVAQNLNSSIKKGNQTKQNQAKGGKISNWKKSFLLSLFVVSILSIGGVYYFDQKRQIEDLEFMLANELEKKFENQKTQQQSLIQQNEANTERRRYELIVSPLDIYLNKLKENNDLNAMDNNVTVVDTKNIDLVRINWDHSMSNFEKEISKISIKNNTHKPITSIALYFEIFGIDGIQVNSGEFMIRDIMSYGGYEVVLINPLQTKEIERMGIRESPKKMDYEHLILFVKDINYADSKGKSDLRDFPTY
jgi:curved DNA-binding protein CbpA